MTIRSKECEQLYSDQQGKCALTGRVLHYSDTSLDHITPLTHGGTYDIDNVWMVTGAANRAKGTMQMREFVTLCRDVVNVHGHLLDELAQGDATTPAAQSPTPTLDNEKESLSA